MSSFANQKKLVHDSKTEESDGQSKEIPIHVYSLDGARAEQNGMSRLLELPAFLESMGRLQKALSSALWEIFE